MAVAKGQEQVPTTTVAPNSNAAAVREEEGKEKDRMIRGRIAELLRMDMLMT